MINEYCAKSYCSEDMSLIENYHQAISDQTRMWEIHHRKECDDEGRTLFTHKQLKEMKLYFNRPANELIFVTRSTHNKIHQERSVKGGKIACEKMTFEQRSKAGKIGGKIAGKILNEKLTFEQRSKGGKNPAGIEKRSIPVLQFSKDGTFIKDWPSISEASRKLGIARTYICACCKGRCESACGFVWRYKHGRI